MLSKKNYILKNSWKKMTIAESLRLAIREEMIRDKKVFCIGEDIGIKGGFGGAFTVTLGLSDEFGNDRIINEKLVEIEKYKFILEEHKKKGRSTQKNISNLEKEIISFKIRNKQLKLTNNKNSNQLKNIESDKTKKTKELGLIKNKILLSRQKIERKKQNEDKWVVEILSASRIDNLLFRDGGIEQDFNILASCTNTPLFDRDQIL